MVVKLAALCVLSLAAHGRSASYPPVSTNCTDASSKLVSWEIRNFTFDSNSRFYFGPGTAGKVSFSIKNSANGYAFACLQGNGNTGRVPNHFERDGKVWYACNVYCYGAQGVPLEDNPPLDTSFSFDLGTKELIVNQAWSCGNSVGSANYTATGTAVIHNISCNQVPGGRPDQVACAPVDVMMKATNISAGVPPIIEEPLEDGPDPSSELSPGNNPFASSYTADPGVRHDTPGCNKRSQNPSWTVSDLLHSENGVRFSLTNNALNYSQLCGFVDFSAEFESRLQSKTWSNCTRYDPFHVNYPSNGIFTSVLYGGTQNIVFGVNQTWYCDDEDPNNPTVYSAYAETNILVKCNETRSCTPPDLYQENPTLSMHTSCKADNITIVPIQEQTYHVSKEQAIDDFRPRGYNCSSRSLGELGAPVWEISGFSFSRTWVPSTAARDDPFGFMDETRFVFKSTATDSDWPANGIDRTCYAETSPGGKPFDGTDELACASFQIRDRGFKFDFNSSTLTLNQAWMCDGRDRFHTNFFKAIGSVRLPLQCKAVGNETQCTTTDKITVPMSNLTTNLNVESTGDYNPFG